MRAIKDLKEQIEVPYGTGNIDMQGYTDGEKVTFAIQWCDEKHNVGDVGSKELITRESGFNLVFPNKESFDALCASIEDCKSLFQYLKDK